MEDQQVIVWYWQRCTDAIIQSKEKYGAYCFTITERILQNQQDSKECVSDTWLHVWNAMPPNHPIPSLNLVHQAEILHTVCGVCYFLYKKIL